MNRSMLVWTLAVTLIALVACFAGCSRQNTVTEQTPQNVNSEGSSSIVGQSLDAGKSAQCRSQLTQLRQGIETYRISTETNPSSLAEMNIGVGEEFYKCPVSGEAYIYDAGTGTVRCVNPQHVRY